MQNKTHNTFPRFELSVRPRRLIYGNPEQNANTIESTEQIGSFVIGEYEMKRKMSIRSEEGDRKGSKAKDEKIKVEKLKSNILNQNRVWGKIKGKDEWVALSGKEGKGKNAELFKKSVEKKKVLSKTKALEKDFKQELIEKQKAEYEVEVVKVLEKKFAADILSLETKMVTLENFKKFLAMTREINEAAFEFTNGFLREKFPTQDEKISGKILGGVRNLVALGISQFFTTILHLPMGSFSSEIAHMQHVRAAGGDPSLLLVNPENTKILAKDLTFRDFFMALFGQPIINRDKRAANETSGEYTPKEKALRVGADINLHTEIAREDYLRISEGKGNLANAMVYILEKINGLGYFLKEDDPNGDPDKYLEILKEEMGIEISKDEVIQQMAMSMLSGGVINYAWKSLKFIFGKDQDGKIEPIGITIFGRRVMLPELSTNLNADNVSQQIDVPIQWSKDTLVIPGFEKAVLGNEDVPMEARIKLIKNFAQARAEAEVIVNEEGATRFAGGVSGEFKTEGGTKVGYAGEFQTAGEGTMQAARDNPAKTPTVVARISLEKDGNYLNLGGGYNENGLSLDATVSANGEIDPNNLHPTAQKIFIKLGIPQEKWVELAEAGYLRYVKWRFLAMIHDGEVSEKEINLDFKVDLFGKTAIFGETDVNIVAGVNAGIGTNLGISPYMMARWDKSAEILASTKIISAHLKFGKKYKALVGGVIDSKGNIGPSIGGEVLAESGVGKSLTIAYTGKDLIFEHWLKKSYIWGDENKVARFGFLSGVESFSITNPGKMEVNKQGQIEAYNAINTRKGLLLLFQYQDKPEEIKKTILEISEHLKPLWDNGKSVYFSENFLKRIASKGSLYKFRKCAQRISDSNRRGLADFIKNDQDKNLDSIIFNSLDGEGNEYNDATGDLVISNIDGDFPKTEEMKIRQVEFPEGYDEKLKQDLETFQKKFGFVVERAEELEKGQQDGLKKLFKLITTSIEDGFLDAAKILNKQIKFTKGMSWRGLGEALTFVSRHSFRDAHATMNLNKSVLEGFAENYIGKTETRSSYHQSVEFKKYSQEKRNKIDYKVFLFEQKLLPEYKSQLGVNEVAFISRSEFEKDFPAVYSEEEGKQEGLFGRKGEKLYVNINELAFSSELDVKNKMALALNNQDFLKTIDFLKKSKTQESVHAEMRMSSGAAEAKLYDLRPKQLKTPKITEDKITCEYTIDDVYGDAIEKKNEEGEVYDNDYKIEFTAGKIEVTIRAGGARRENSIV
jgi:hypothetical protein